MSEINVLSGSSNTYDDVVKKFFNAPLSRLPVRFTKSTTILPGAIVPIDCGRLLPNETRNLHYNLLLKNINPLQAPSLTKWRLYTWTVYNRDSDLWKGSKEFYTKGRSGKSNLNYPFVPYSDYPQTNHVSCTYSTPMSLFDYLDFPVMGYNPKNGVNNEDDFHLGAPVKYKNANGSDVTFTLGDKTFKAGGQIHPVIPNGEERADALFFMMYQRFCRDYRFNADLLSDNLNWYPSDDDDFIIPKVPNAQIYDLSASSAGSYAPLGSVLVIDSEYNNGPLPVSINNLTPSSVHPLFAFSNMDSEAFVPSSKTLKEFGFETNNDNHSPVFLPALHFDLFKKDYFNSASPFPELMRGDIPVLGDYINQSVDDYLDNYISSTQGGNNAANLIGKTEDTSFSSSKFLSFSQHPEEYSKLLKDVLKSAQNNTTLSSIKALEVWSQFRQRMASTDGSYNQLVFAQFGYNPHSHELRATYCGGSFTDVVFNEVVSTSDTNSKALGDKVSNAQALSGNDSIEIFSPDFGRYMTFACLVPELIYNNSGVDRNIKALTFDEIPFPATNGLGAEAILQKELNYTGNPDLDDLPFGFAERNSYMRQNRNKVNGLFSLGEFDVELDSMVGRRDFSKDDVLKLSNDFVTMSPKNIKNSVMRQFASLNRCPFTLTVGVNGSKLGPYPYSNGVTSL